MGYGANGQYSTGLGYTNDEVGGGSNYDGG